MPTPSAQVDHADRSPHQPRPNRFPIFMTLLGVLPFATLCALFALDAPLGQPGLVYRYSPLVGWRVERAAIGAVIGCLGLLALTRWTRGRGILKRESNLPYSGGVSIYACHDVTGPTSAAIESNVSPSDPIRTATARNGAATVWERFFNPWLALALTGYVGLIAWSFLAPPQAILQHTFNMLSPSHEGAFVLEARHVESVSSYVSRDFPERLQLSPEEMRGRRVLSNPPGMTVAAAMVRDGIGSLPGLERGLVSLFGLNEVEDPALRREMAAGLTLAVLLTIAWGASFFPFLLLFREFCPPLMAVALAFACVFNPSTVHFTPGKDAAQLLFIGLLCWCAARTMIRGRWGYAFAGGAILTVSLAVGLVHAWVALILMIAALWHALNGGWEGLTTCTFDEMRTADFASQGVSPDQSTGMTWMHIVVPPCLPRPKRDPAGHDVIEMPLNWCGWKPWLRAAVIPAGIGMALTASTLWCVADWNVFLHTWRVGQRYGEIQLPIITDPLGWTFVGAGLFLLFIGSMAWALLALHRKPDTEAARFGLRLLIVTFAVMLYSYFFGNNSETPRLWIPFIPLLIWGLSIRRGSCVKPEPADPSARAVNRRIALLLLALQLLVTLAHWSLLDVRESEYRLVTGRMWD